ncbi:HvfC family RiPP maturation protein [Sulfurirhabdus autotrophica]|uniref:Uncharacterized protein n=1 Tax=Sulfurirhabdus autotrophica TaxID=1706046 RepID=A0A4R3XZF6_9PROT|nr:putative DNA-binding domain-containing protein [Sulfurirhabdus autotrophica]TCV85165.1 hypothetical protein EDC63_11054 [Sulfurirhabdus autotrophica]
MSEKPDIPLFQQYQYAFTGHIRNPRENKRPQGVPARRMKVYNELLYNNLEGFLLACFPVLHKVSGKRKWAKLVRDFFSTHRCHSPFFRQIPDEFIHYLKNERGEQPEDPAFMRDLAHYEWVELMLSISNKEIEHNRIDPDGDLLNARPAITPLLSLQSYAYPVHKIGPRFKPTTEQKEDTHFAIVRNKNDEVKFILINPISMRLLTLLQSSSLTGKGALLQIATELQHPDPAVVLAGGLDILHSLYQSEVILGTWKGCDNM